MILKGLTNAVSPVSLCSPLLPLRLVGRGQGEVDGVSEGGLQCPFQSQPLGLTGRKSALPQWGCGHHWPGLISLALSSFQRLSQPSAFLTFLYSDWSAPGPASAAPTSPHGSMSYLCVYNNTPMYINSSYDDSQFITLFYTIQKLGLKLCYKYK